MEYIISISCNEKEQYRFLSLKYQIEEILKGQVRFIWKDVMFNVVPPIEYTSLPQNEIVIIDNKNNELYRFFEDKDEMIIAKLRGFVLSNEWKNSRTSW